MLKSSAVFIKQIDLFSLKYLVWHLEAMGKKEKWRERIENFFFLKTYSKLLGQKKIGWRNQWLNVLWLNNQEFYCWTSVAIGSLSHLKVRQFTKFRDSQVLREPSDELGDDFLFFIGIF